MKKCLLILVALMVLSVPAWSARITEIDLGTVNYDVYQAGWCGEGSSVAVPGVLVLNNANYWDEYVSNVGPYVLRNATLIKQVPTNDDCIDWNSIGTIHQKGTSSIRTWWPLMYDPPGTTFTLVLQWRQGLNWYVQKVVWTVKADFSHLKAAIALFESLPFGTSEVPLVSENMAADLLDDISALEGFLATPGDEALLNAQLAFGALVNDILDNCNSVLPPKPDKSYSGIAATTENPACCKLYLDAVAIGEAIQIDTPGN